MEFFYNKLVRKFYIKRNTEIIYLNDNIAIINNFIDAIYGFIYENKTNSYIFNITNEETTYKIIIDKVTNQELNIKIEELGEDKIITIENIIKEIEKITKEYFKIHSIDPNKEFEYEKYQKMCVVEKKSKYCFKNNES